MKRSLRTCHTCWNESIDAMSYSYAVDMWSFQVRVIEHQPEKKVSVDWHLQKWMASASIGNGFF